MMMSYPFFGFPSYRRNYSYSPSYYNLRNSSMHGNRNEQSPCFPSVTQKKEQGNLGCSSTFSKNTSFSNGKNASCMNNNFNNKKQSTCFNNDFNCKKTNTNMNNTADCNCCNNFDVCNEFNSYDEEQCFEIFGIKLHFDDLLIIALLFFLYQEDVKDTYLYIALILLLLS